MDSRVKCGNGYGYGYGYGNSKPQMNYHRQNSESVTTVVTEINRMSVNDKPCYGDAGGVQKQACKVEAFEGHDEAYNGAVAVHKHSFKEEKDEKYGAAAVKKHDEYKEKYGEVVDAEYGAHYGGGGAAVKKHGYGYKQEAYGETEAAAAGYGGAHYGGAVGKNQGYNYKQEAAYGQTEAARYGGAHYGAGAGGKKQGYIYTQEACGESDVAGYGAHHGGSGAAVQTYAHDQQAAYGGAIGAAVQQQAYKHTDAASKMNGSQQKVYGYGECVDAAGAGYGAHYGGGAVQQHGYHKDAYGHGAAAAAGGKVTNGYQYQEAYGGTDAAGGYGAHYGGAGGGAVQQYGYQKDAYGYGGGAAGGKVKKTGYQYQEAYGGTGAGGYGGAHYGGGGAAVQKHGYMHDVYESETESESDESDCEEAFPPRGGRMQGGVQHSYQEAYGGTGAGGYGGAHYGGGGAAVQKHGYMHDVYESETESESDVSDCEEAFPPRGGRMQGGVQHSYGVYKQENHGAGNLGVGGVRRYESYESREELGGGRRYDTYQTTVQYTGGGGYGTCSPIRNGLRYGA